MTTLIHPAAALRLAADALPAPVQAVAFTSYITISTHENRRVVQFQLPRGVESAALLLEAGGETWAYGSHEDGELHATVERIWRITTDVETRAYVCVYHEDVDAFIVAGLLTADQALGLAS